MSESRRDRARRVLEPSHQRKRINTDERLDAAVLRLQAKKTPITRKALQEETADPATDPPMPGIHPSTIGRRPEILKLIDEAPGAMYPGVDLSHISLNHLRENRVLLRVLERLQRRDHTQLVGYTLVLEEEVISLRQDLDRSQSRNKSLERKNWELSQKLLEKEAGSDLREVASEIGEQ